MYNHLGIYNGHYLLLMFKYKFMYMLITLVSTLGIVKSALLMQDANYN